MECMHTQAVLFMLSSESVWKSHPSMRQVADMPAELVTHLTRKSGQCCLTLNILHHTTSHKLCRSHAQITVLFFNRFWWKWEFAFHPLSQSRQFLVTFSFSKQNYHFLSRPDKNKSQGFKVSPMTPGCWELKLKKSSQHPQLGYSVPWVPHNKTAWYNKESRPNTTNRT